MGWESALIDSDRSDLPVIKNDCNCRCECYLGEELLVDLESPTFPNAKFGEVLSWLWEKLREVLECLTEEERGRFHGTVHFRVFTDNITSGFTIPAKVAAILGKAKLDVRFVYYCSSHPEGESFR